MGENKTSIVAQRLKGFRDHMPATMMIRQHVIGALRELFELHGFAPLETPALEYASTLEGKYGEEERLIYKFEDKGGRMVGLRYDLTVPLARVVANHMSDLQFPWKRYQISPVWRGENPQFGRYREFYQCDVDIVGAPSMLADAETMSMYAEAMRKLGFSGYRLLINNRKLMSGLARSAGVAPEQSGTIFRALDKLDKIGGDAVRDEMVSHDIDRGTASRVMELFLAGKNAESNEALLSELAGPLANDAQATEGLNELRQVLDALQAMGEDMQRFMFDITLARGLDYYTGPVFELVVDEPKIGALGGGGRYDKLVGMFSGRDLPTVGGTLGLERIIDVMTTLHMVESSATPSKVLITLFDNSQQSMSASLRLATDLRGHGIPCEVYLTPGDKLGKQFAYADRLGIPYAIVLGPDEVAQGAATVKSLKSPPPNQRTVPLPEIVNVLNGL